MTIYIKAFFVAMIVGSTLLIINQFDALFGESNIRVIPAVLTYCVPFIVFMFGNRCKGTNDSSKGDN